MRAALLALMLSFATQAGAECGKLCDYDWWKTATVADVQAELDAGANIMARTENGATPIHSTARRVFPDNIIALLDAGAEVMVRDKYGKTPLYWAAQSGTPVTTQALLDGGADAKAKDKNGKTPWDLAYTNEKLKGTKAYRALNDAQYN